VAPAPATGIDLGPEYAARRDEEDPLADLRERFHVPEGLYIDGNSLGPLSRDAERSLKRTIEEWRTLGVNGWTDADEPWFHCGERLGARLAPLVGTDGEEVVIANSATVNVRTLVGTFLDRADGAVCS